MKKTMGYVAAMAFVGIQAGASSINWGTAEWLQGGDGSQDVYAVGTLVDAINAYGSDVTLAGVTFKGTNSNSGITISGWQYDNFIDDNPSPSLNTDYNALLDPALYNVTQIEITGLTVGQEYAVQLWSSDSRAYSSHGRHLVLDGTATVYENQSTEGGQVTLGQQIVGTFIADATSQLINNFAGYESDGAANGQAVLFNAAQVRAIPEPTTLGMLGVCAATLLFIRRKFMI